MDEHTPWLFSATEVTTSISDDKSDELGNTDLCRLPQIVHEGAERLATWLLDPTERDMRGPA